MARRITAATRVAGVLGDPVAHSLSPAMHNAAIASLGLDALYAAFHVAPGQLGRAMVGLHALGFAGANITIPHKVAACCHVDRLSPAAAAIGAVNTVHVDEEGVLVGSNTDCEGVVRAAEAAGAKLRHATVVILGAGGAARAAAAGCAFAGAHRIIVLNRTKDHAAALVRDLSRSDVFGHSPFWQSGALDADIAWGDVSVAFQMTSVGMNSEEMPLDPSVLPRGCHVVEAVYAPLETAFLRAAKAKGLHATDGLAMLVEQGALSFELWFGQEPDRAVMRKAALEARS